MDDGAQFDPAFDWSIRHEDYSLSGAVTEEPPDKDGNVARARLGINSAANPKAVTDGFYSMPLQEAIDYAKSIYRRDYWDSGGLGRLSDQRLATKLFDGAINMGVGTAIGLLQQVLFLPATHRLDPSTLETVNRHGPELVERLATAFADHYRKIAASNPARYGKYLPGWLARAVQLPPESAETGEVT